MRGGDGASDPIWLNEEGIHEMPMNPDIFKYATAVRDSVTKEQQAYIEEAYKKWSEDVLEQAEYYSKLTTGSSSVSQAYYQQLYQQMQAQSKEIANGVYTNITNGMAQVSDAVVKDAVNWMSGFGFSKKGLDAAFSYIPQSTVNSLITGSVYGKPGSWSLSAAIWGDNEKTLRDIYSIMSQGIAAQMPIEEMAKKLSQYVDPNKQLSWTGPNGMRIYKHAVDYNAQRLARTLVQHTYQQSFVAATKDNPFVTEYVWIANGSRVCPICADRDGTHYKKDKLPLDHPNGMCTMEPVVDNDIADKLAKWVNSEDGTYPEIDEFAKKFGYDASKMPKMTLDEIKKKYTHGIDSKTPSKWFKSLPKDVQDTVSQIHQESGLKWTQWYKKNIMNGGEDITDDMLKAAVKSAKDDTKNAAKAVNEAKNVTMKEAAKSLKSVTGDSMLDDEILGFLDDFGVGPSIKNMEDWMLDDLKAVFKKYGKDYNDYANNIDEILAAVSKKNKVIASSVDDVVDDVVSAVKKVDHSLSKSEIDAAKKAVSELTEQKGKLDAVKKELTEQANAFDKKSVKVYSNVKKKFDKDGWNAVEGYLTKDMGYQRYSDFANELADAISESADDLVKSSKSLAKAKEKLEESLKWADEVGYGDWYKAAERQRFVNRMRREANYQYLNGNYDKLPKAIVKRFDDAFEKYIGITKSRYDLYETLSDQLSDVKAKLNIINSELKVQKAIAKGATKEFAAKSYDEAMSYLKGISYNFYKNEVVKKSDAFMDAINDICEKAKTDDVKKAFQKYSSGQIKSEKFDGMIDLAQEYKAGLHKTEKVVSSFSPDDYTDAAKKAAKSYSSRKTADKTLRKWLDDGWDELDDNQKFSVWKYTENSNPMNKPLSGYAHGSWSRSDFVGVGNADWGTEDNWRHLGSSFSKKFGKNGTNKVDHASAIADLTMAIDNYELEESMWLVRGSDTNGLAGMFEGAGFDFDDIKKIFNSSGDTYKQFEGVVVQNHAFTSTGIADDAGFDGAVKYKIYAPKGTRAIYAEPQSYYGNTISGEELYTVGHSRHGVGGEAEMILQRGTEFRITSIRKTGFGQYEIEMEVVDQPRYFGTGFEQTINNGLTSFK